MVDWTELFMVTSKQFGDLIPVSVIQVAQADKDEMLRQTNSVQFDDEDVIKQLTQKLIEQSQATMNVLRKQYQIAQVESAAEVMTELDLMKSLDDLIEIIDNTQDCHVQMCTLGGMEALLTLMIAHQSEKIRKHLTRIFIRICNNNPKVQEYALKNAAINLAYQLERETTPLMREAMLGCLSSFIRADSFPGKRQYVAKLDGIKQLSDWICEANKATKYGNVTQQRQIVLKLLGLIKDMVQNDDSIVNNGTYVRQRICDEPA